MSTPQLFAIAFFENALNENSELLMKIVSEISIKEPDDITEFLHNLSILVQDYLTTTQELYPKIKDIKLKIISDIDLSQAEWRQDFK